MRLTFWRVNTGLHWDSSERRAERERRAYDETRVWETNHAWMERVIHVTLGPNTQRHEQTFSGLLRDAVRHGGRALDVGCGAGNTTRQLLGMGASYALGVDVSEAEIRKARALAVPGRAEFSLGSVHEPIEGRFDLICGRSILHHLDFREFLARCYQDNLRAGGRMVFMEPLSHPFALAFHRFVRSAHTEDEWPLRPRDIAWMRNQFPSFRLIPINLVSFGTGIVSTFVCSRPNNLVMRASDRLDEWYRQGIIVIRSGDS